MNKEIYIAIVDDWELRGNGSGDVHQTQVVPMKRLISVLEKYGVKYTINAEVMQQLTMKKYASENQSFETATREWEEALKDGYSRGNDVQLHIHPQWDCASYKDSHWVLDDNWDITKYSSDDVNRMISEGIKYLEDLLQGAKISGFRSGSWSAAPSDFFMDTLQQKGIKLDISLCAGLKYNTKHVKLDYTELENDFGAFYPDMKDARKISSNKENIVCIPTFHYSRNFFWKVLSGMCGIIHDKLTGNTRTVEVSSEWRNAPQEKQSRIKSLLGELKKMLFTKTNVIGELGGDFNKVDMYLLIKSIIRRAQHHPGENIPVVLEHHTKDLMDTTSLEYFLKKMTGKKNVHFVTITQIVDMLERGEFVIAKR